MTFEEAERQYQLLLGQWQAGQISPEGFQQALNNLQVQTQDGSFWRIAPEDGSWLRWDGVNWIATIPTHKTSAPPPGTPGAPHPATAGPPSQNPPEAKNRRRWWLACSVILLISCCCLSLAAGGGYLAVQAGTMSALELSTTLSGVAGIDIANLDDYSLSVELSQLDVPVDEAGSDRLNLESFDIGSFAGIPPGRYRIDFVSESNPLVTLTCTINAERGDAYQFVAVPEGLAIARENEPAQEAAELDVATSTLCRR